MPRLATFSTVAVLDSISRPNVLRSHKNRDYKILFTNKFGPFKSSYRFFSCLLCFTPTFINATQDSVHVTGAVVF
jgi:hypothetical protein